MLREMEHLQFILRELRFSERQRCFPVLNAARSCKVTSLYFGQIHLSAGLRVSAFQKSTGLEPSKFRPQVIPLCKKQKALLFIHKKVWAFREFLRSFCPALSSVEVTQNQFYISLTRLIALWKLSAAPLQRPWICLWAGSMFGKNGKDNKKFLIRKPLLLYGAPNWLKAVKGWEKERV